MTISAALFSSESQTWNTPECVLERVRRMGRIGLDPCGNTNSIVGASEEWRIERGEDGLARPWSTVGLVYVNPPYDDIEAWAKKMAAEATRAEIVACIPARTETVAFQRYILPTAAAICFWRGRMRFNVGPAAGSRQIGMFGEEPSRQATGDNTAPFPSALPYWGKRADEFAAAFRDAGWILRTHQGALALGGE